MSFFLENDFATYHIRDGILRINYRQGISIDLPTAILIVEDRMALQEGLPYPVLCDIRGIHEVDKSARDYLAIEGSVLVTAVAFLIEPTVSRVLSEFFLRIHNPPIPSKAFTDREAALAFLAGFKKNKT